MELKQDGRAEPFGNREHCAPDLFVVGLQIRGLERCPAGLLLNDRQTLCGSQVLAHATMAEQVWVDRRELAGLTVSG